VFLHISISPIDSSTFDMPSRELTHQRQTLLQDEIRRRGWGPGKEAVIIKFKLLLGQMMRLRIRLIS